MSDSITGTVWDGTRALGTATLAWSGDRIDSVTSSSGDSDLSIIPGSWTRTCTSAPTRARARPTSPRGG